MADGKTTLTKPMSELLAPGEELLGGCKAAGKNAALKAGVGAALTGATGRIVNVGSGAVPEGGWAAVVPQDRVFWIGATSSRLVYWGVGAMTSKPKDFRGETPLPAIASVTATKRTAFHRLEIAFVDASTTVVDLYRANSPDSLLQALEHLLPGKIVSG
jgi:hypothetical protein